MISNIHIKTPPNNKLNKQQKNLNTLSFLLKPQKKPPTQQTSGNDTASHADSVSQIPLKYVKNV